MKKFNKIYPCIVIICMLVLYMLYILLKSAHVENGSNKSTEMVNPHRTKRVNKTIINPHTTKRVNKTIINPHTTKGVNNTIINPHTTKGVNKTIIVKLDLSPKRNKFHNYANHGLPANYSYIRHKIRLHRVSDKQSKTVKPDNTTMPYLYFIMKARFGNNIFQYVSSYCLALESNHTATINYNNPLLSVFDGIKGKVIGRVDKDVYPTYLSNGWGLYDEDLVNWVKDNKNHSIIVNGYLQSFKYIGNYVKDIRSQLVLNQNEQTKVKVILHETQKRLIDNQNQNASVVKPIFIGVHVRRTDVHPFAPLSYFAKAFQYYRNKYQKVLFLICSEDSDWCRRELVKLDQNDTFIVSNSNRGFKTDFGVLMSCNHSIITGGTFSWWSAWLAGGEVVYSLKWPSYQTKIDPKRYHRTDYYPLHWIPM